MRRKSKKSSRDRFIVFAAIIFIVIFSLIYFGTFYMLKIRPSESPIPIDKLLSFRPDLSGQTPLGDSRAVITIVAYSSFTGDAGRRYHSEVFPFIYKEYVEKGIVRYYHRPFLLKEDIEKTTLEYNLSLYLECIKNREDYWESYKKLAENPLILFQEGDFALCYNLSHRNLEQEAERNAFFGILAEPTLFIGIQGTYNTLLTGIPSQNRLARTIRQKQILIGKE